jgi:hypothetical protein
MQFLCYKAGYTVWNKEKSDEVKVTARNEEDGRTHERKKKLAGTSAEDSIRKISQAASMLLTDRKMRSMEPNKNVA